MMAATITTVVTLFVCSSIHTAVIGDTIKLDRCNIDLIEGWSGWCKKNSRDETCTYIPSPGWAIIGNETVVTGKNGDGRFSSTQITSTENKLVTLHQAQQVFMALIVSGQLGTDDVNTVGNLSLEYSKLRSKAPANGEAAFQVKGHASAHGECWDRKRGWIYGHLDIEEMYMGQNYKDIVDWIVFKDQALGPIVQNLKCDANDCYLS